MVLLALSSPAPLQHPAASAPLHGRRSPLPIAWCPRRRRPSRDHRLHGLSDRSHKPPNGNGGYRLCESSDCVNHAKLLALNESRAVQACDDFSLFVCSARERQHKDIADSFIGQVVVNWVLDSVGQLNSDYTGEALAQDAPVESRTRQLMDLCLDKRPSDDRHVVNAFKEFLKSEELSFLAHRGGGFGANYTKVLEAVVILTAKWMVPLWFRLEMLPNHYSNGSRIFVIMPESLELFWQLAHDGLLQAGKYEEYVELFVNELYDGGMTITSGYLKFLLDRSSSVQIED
ncbi:uncharacterized protein LOC144179830 [Haemaphysalis longicornis]